MSTFQKIYEDLNTAQRRAVDTIYGPVLVIAGPGTGKTQLLSARVVHILEQTDTLPQNILCLTFTENGAQNMRERLGRFIGQAAYDVQISTYHAFGASIISRYPEYFTDLRLDRPVDELGKRQILSSIIDSLEYQSPLKQLRHHLGDLVSTVSEVKRGLLTPDDLRRIAKENERAINDTQPFIAEILAPHTARIPGKLTVAEPLFKAIYERLSALTTSHPNQNSGQRIDNTPRLVGLATQELSEALDMAEKLQSTKPLTAWKNAWLIKDHNNQFCLVGGLESKRLAALGSVLESYQKILSSKGLYDFDDMILQALKVLSSNDDLRFTLHEQYQFILLDEFQDTNAAQLRLIQLLTDNPVLGGKPNVLAVGDDDQAIYAFQGAEYSNMLDFYNMYEDVKVIALKENYRSQAEIIHAADAVAQQIKSRLHHQFVGVTKNLRAASKELPEVQIARHSYKSPIAELVGISNSIARLIQNGVKPSQIAVLAPKHKYLEPLVPYLQSRSIPVAYEKRENILEAPAIRELLTMSKLVLALHRGDEQTADSLWAEVLSYDFWDFSVGNIWDISWRANDEKKPWSQLLVDSPEFRHAAVLFLSLATKAENESLEYILDALIGTTDVSTHDRTLPSVRSPYREYYFKLRDETILYETVTQLTVLRTKLREHEAGESSVLNLANLLEFAQSYDDAEQPLLNTSPYSQNADAVQLMTVYKAKGLEFDHVFLVACDDSVWGSRATGVGNKLTLPPNVAAIRHAGSTDDERLRLLYVAMTRARFGLHLTSHEKTYSGRTTEAVKYFDEFSDDTGASHIRILPKPYQKLVFSEKDSPSLEALTMNWQQRHYNPPTPLLELLRNRLSRYRLSPTHLTHFLDLKYGGPQSFLLATILRFPSAQTADIVFGNAVHDTLQWLQGELNLHDKLPDLTATIMHTDQYLAREALTPEQYALQSQRARFTLENFLASSDTKFIRGNIAEKSFRDEGVLVRDARMGGKVDLLEVDHEKKTIVVVDYKTGRLGNDAAKLRRYTLQLYCYKLLVENSHTFRGYNVGQGKLVFVEPEESKIIRREIDFTDTETARAAQLIEAMWQCVMTLQLPDTSKYGDSLRDSRAFEDQLIENHQKLRVIE